MHFLIDNALRSLPKLSIRSIHEILKEKINVRGKKIEENGGDQFAGFQTCAHKDDIVFRRCLSPRLQSRAPCPIQVMKPNVCSASFHGGQKSLGVSSTNSSWSSSSSPLNSFYHSKDPIPLLSPLVLPSLLESACIQEENVTNPIESVCINQKSI